MGEKKLKSQNKLGNRNLNKVKILNQKFQKGKTADKKMRKQSFGGVLRDQYLGSFYKKYLLWRGIYSKNNY